MPAKESPTAMRLMSMVLVPIAWITRSMVPASASQSASVSGISSPLSHASTRTNWPACAAERATSGECTLNSTMPPASSILSTMVWARLAEFGVARGLVDPRADLVRRERDVADDFTRRRLTVTGRADRRGAAARRVAARIHVGDRGLLRALPSSAIVPHLVVLRPGSPR